MPSTIREQVVEYLTTNGAAKMAEIADSLQSKPYRSVQSEVLALHREGVLDRPRRGIYEIAAGKRDMNAPGVIGIGDPGEPRPITVPDSPRGASQTVPGHSVVLFRIRTPGGRTIMEYRAAGVQVGDPIDLVMESAPEVSDERS